jgi:glucokinase
MKYSLGVDVGGTNIRMAIVSSNGKIEKVIKKRTKPTKSADDLVNQIVDLYQEIDAQNYDIVGMGIGLPGPVVQETGFTYVLSNLGIYNFNLKEPLEAKLNLSVTIGNDANLAGYAEATLGGGRGYKVIQFITISTGIGGGLIVNGQIISGANGFAQEIGNMLVDQNSERKQNEVMANGSFESLCSGTGIVLSAKEVGLNIEHAGQLFELANGGNEAAIKVKKTWLKNMGIALSNMVAYMEPDVFILGGGVMLSKQYFLEELKQEIDKSVFPQIRGKINIKPAAFDQDAGIIGAALVCFSK